MLKSFRIIYRNQEGLPCAYVTTAQTQNLAIQNLWTEHPYTKTLVSSGSPEVNPIISITCKLN